MLSQLNSLRRMGIKARRRVLSLVGKPDKSPWVLMPPRRPVRHEFADFVFALDYLSTNGKLLKLFHQAMAPLGISVLLVNKNNVAWANDAARKGSLRPYVFLDLCSLVNDPFENLLYEFAKRGVYTIRKPEHTPWVSKCPAHRELLKGGINLPPSIFIGPNDPDRELSAEERAFVGDRVAIKPSLGGGGRGVVVNVEPTMANIAKARDYDRKSEWMVQKMMTWVKLGGRSAYVRVYNVMGARSVVWWCMDEGGYKELTWDEFERYDLMPLIRIADRITCMSGMDYFSVEAIQTAESGPNRFCLLDYLNDQCDVDPEACPGLSPPETWVTWVCQQFADFTWRLKLGLPPAPVGSVHLAPAGAC